MLGAPEVVLAGKRKQRSPRRVRARATCVNVACALVGSRYAIPDIGLAAFGEISAGIRDIMGATRLPILVDCDTGYGDVKNVAHTIQGY